MKEKSEKFVPKTEIYEDCSHNKKIIICPHCGKEITICEFFKKNFIYEKDDVEKNDFFVV